MRKKETGAKWIGSFITSCRRRGFKPFFFGINAAPFCTFVLDIEIVVQNISIYERISRNKMKYEITILDTQKFLYIMIVGAVITVFTFIITLMNIKYLGVYTWLFSWIVMIPFFFIGLKKSKIVKQFIIEKGKFKFGNNWFGIDEITSYEYLGGGYSRRLNLRLKNKKMISIISRESYPDKEKFVELVNLILESIEDYNSKNENEIIQYDPYHARYSILIGVIVIIVDLGFSYFLWTFGNDKKYLGIILTNLILIRPIIPIFTRKKKK